MEDLTPAQIAAWFRAKAREYNQKADDLERDFNVQPEPQKEAAFLEGANIGDVMAVQEFVGKKKSARIADISKEIGLSEAAVRFIVSTRPDLFVKGDQGWFKLTQQGSDEYLATLD